MRRAGRAVRPRIRRAAGEPLLWRGAGFTHVLRPRSDGTATAARCVPGVVPSSRSWHRANVPAHPRAKITALNGVVEKPVNTVAIVLIIFRRIDAALSRNAVRPARTVLEAETFYLVT